MKTRVANKIVALAIQQAFRCSCIYRSSQISSAIAAADDNVIRRMVEIPQRVKHWGEYHDITPMYVPGRMGDGRALCYLIPLNTRPNYYVLRIDSCRDIYDQIDDEFGIYARIEERFGDAMSWCETCGHGGLCECSCCKEYREWPALDCDSGSCWHIFPENKRQ